MVEDLVVDYGKTRDESEPQRDGSIKRSRVYTFWVGKHGPFVERVELTTPFDEQEIGRRVEAVRGHLRALPR